MKHFNFFQPFLRHTLLGIFTIVITVLNAQDQAIGSFPSMQGGFEKFNTGNLTVNALSTSGTQTTEWTVSLAASTTYSINTTTARTGSRYLVFGNTTGARRWHTPTAPDGNTATGIQNGTQYVIQYYYRTSGATNITSLVAQLNTDGGTAGPATTPALMTATNGAWTKAVVTITASSASTATPRYGVGGLRSTATTTVNVDVDDYVVYPGSAADNSAPDPASVAVFTPASSQIGVSWTAPGTGVDGGGYMVVRGLADPTTTPNGNGIYAEGNTVATGEQVVYIGTGTSFTDIGLANSTHYYYRIYTVDKAFNYSTALIADASTTAAGYATEPTAQVTGLNFTSVSSTGMTINWTSAISGGGTNHLVVIGTSLTGDPADGSTYTANTDFTSGSSSTVAGGKVVYNGTGNSVSVTGLTYNTIYYVRVYDFNGSAGTENYYSTSPASESQITDRITITSAQSGPCTTVSTWVGGVVPTQNDNVVIANGHVVTFTSTGTTNAYNLTVNSGAQIYNITGSPTYTLGSISIYGTSIIVNGTFGDATTEYVSGILFNQNCTLSGSGLIRINRTRPLNTAVNATFTFDADATLTNSNAVALICESSTAGSNNIGYRVNSGRTVTTIGTFSGGSNGTLNAANDISLTIDGTLTINSTLGLNAVNGKSANLVVNGTLNATKFYASNQATGGGAVPTITVNGSGIINVTGTGATADFSNPTTAANITGTGTFALASGSTISIGAVDGLNPSTGPIRCTIRNFNTAANYSFTGTSAQVTGAELPSTINTLTNTNTAGLTLSSNLTTTTLTNDATYILNVDAGKQLTVNTTLTNNGTINLKSTDSGTATLIPPATISGTGTFNTQQYLATTRNWYISSPVVNPSTPGLTTTPDFAGIDYYYEYMEGGNNTNTIGQPGSPTLYWMGLNKGSSMAVGKGYIAKTNAETTVQFTGTPNNGNITTSFNLTRDDAKGKGFNLVGNPYPSYIDWSLVAAANPNLMKTVWFKTKKTIGFGGGYAFASVNVTTPSSPEFVANNANTTITKYIPPTQAFWVRVNSGTSSTSMSFTNAMREHRLNNGDLMKAPKVNERSRIRLQLVNGIESDETLIYFDKIATNDFNEYDSPKMMNNSSVTPDLYTIAGVERLVINGMSEIADNMELPLGFSLDAVASLKLKTTEMSNFPLGTRIYLLDKVESSQVELLPETEYNFNTTTAASNNENRFSLLFRSPGVSTELNSDKSKSQALVFVNANNQITIIAPEKSNYAIYNAVGQKVAAGKIINNLPLTINHSKGIYVVKVGNQSTRVIIK